MGDTKGGGRPRQSHKGEGNATGADQAADGPLPNAQEAKRNNQVRQAAQRQHDSRIDQGAQRLVGSPVVEEHNSGERQDSQQRPRHSFA